MDKTKSIVLENPNGTYPKHTGKLRVSFRLACWFGKVRLHLLAGLFFGLLTVGMTWPVARHLSTHVTPGQQPVMTVPYLNLWTLAWNHRWLQGETESYWDANLFYPHQKTLAYSEPQFGMGILTAPLAFLGANTVLAYNLLLLGFLWGAGMSVYGLCWYLFRGYANDGAGERFGAREIYRWVASATAGVLYGFHFYIFLEMGVLQLLATLFAPLAFLGLHRFVDSNKWRDALIFCVGFLGAWYTCGYYGLFLSVFIFCFVLRFGYRKLFEKRALIVGIGTAAIIIIGLVPLILGMQSAKTAMSLSRPKFVVENLSAVLGNYLKFPQNSWLYEKLLAVSSPDRGTFLGLLLVCLSGIAAIAIFRARSSQRSGGLLGGGDQNLGMFLNPDRFSGRYGVFYIAMAGFAFWLSYGMALIPPDAVGLGIYRFLVWISPYNLLYQFVPGFTSIRSPYRFYIFSVLFLSVLSGCGVLWVSEHVKGQWRRVLIPLILVAVIVELWPLPARLVSVPRSVNELPEIYQEIDALPKDATLLELPLARGGSEISLETEARFLYYSTFHWRPIINGYSGFSPRANIGLDMVIARSAPETLLSALGAFGIEYVLTREDALNAEEKKKLDALVGHGLVPVAVTDHNRLYKVEPNSVDFDDALPPIASLKFHESNKSPDHVSLSLYYEVEENACKLTTPWMHRVEYDVMWYGESAGSEPFFISRAVYRNSHLLTRTSNAIELELNAPPPGKYRVVVQQHSGPGNVSMSGMCQIHESGFVTFSPVDDKTRGG